ncbi:MAG: retroviral-like aspartic protease family protein [Defluviitaleaceae bacterium]|nr:retroviral-like aspartic protease family protein [Defluviitaleaceae bacterium]
MVVLDFDLINAKYISRVKLLPPNSKKPLPYALVFDSGSNMTTISKPLFDKLGYSLEAPKDVIIRGINGESRGISTIINHFEIGGENLGRVRVVVGNLHKNFENSVILGVNVLVWYNYAVIHHKKQIVMEERRIATAIPRQDRFLSLYPQILNLPAFSDETGGQHVTN